MYVCMITISYDMHAYTHSVSDPKTVYTNQDNVPVVTLPCKKPSQRANKRRDCNIRTYACTRRR